MVRAKVGKHIIEMYDTIEDLPMVAFHKFQRLLLVDAGIGGDIQAFDARTERVRQFLALGNIDEARKEMDNLRQCFFLIASEVLPKHRSFAVLVSKIDGKEYGITDADIEEKLRILNDVPKKEIDRHIEAVKKKIEGELSQYFPRLFETSEVKEYYDLLKKRTLSLLEAMAEGRELPNTETITAKLITYSKPKVYAGSKGVEVQYDRQFENLCLTLSENLNVKPKEMSVLEFYNAFDFLQERARQSKKGGF